MTSASSPGDKAASTIRNVQALRAIAALLVVVLHAGLPNVGVESVLAPREPAWLSPFHYIGIFGVDLFFAISGFIMLATNWRSFGDPRASLRFLARRAIRIYPPYWLALAPALAVLCVAPGPYMAAHVGVKTGVLNSILLLPNPDKFVLTVAWTLVWEALFYVVFAVILKFDRQYVLWGLAVWCAAELGLYALFSTSANFYLHFIAAPIPIEFIAGAFVGYLHARCLIRAPRFLTGVALVVTAAMAAFVVVGHVDLGDPNDLRRVLVFGPPAMLLVYAAVALEVHGIFITPRAFATIGDGSYAIYLWHLSVLVVLRTLIVHLHPVGALAHAAVIALTLGIIGVIGMAVYTYFERPVTVYLNGLLAKQLQRGPVVRIGAAIARGVPDIGTD